MKKVYVIKLLFIFLPFNLCFSISYGTLTLGKNHALLNLCFQHVALRRMMYIGTDNEHPYKANFWWPFISANYNPIDRVSLSADFNYYPFKDSKYPQREYSNYTVGFGVKIHFLQSKKLNLCGVLNLRHNVNIDRSPECHHKYYQERFGSFILGYQWSSHKLAIDVHGGPCYLYYRSEDYYGGGSYGKTFLEIGYPLGIFGGFETLLFKHINFEGDVFVTRNIGALFTVGYRF